ncbi:hypothetical protein ANN_19363 [Periplaneta americana]|uniref:Uncharacterized protein n=1 Tax=Periplaneta americana TaxID=6978 RepID=A0ABQ8SA01_PERAM|nr:hypothetical protein ANN_19363 [Periplaneta americana]
MAGLCEGGNEPPGSLKANGVGDNDVDDGMRIEAVLRLFVVQWSRHFKPCKIDYWILFLPEFPYHVIRL